MFQKTAVSQTVAWEISPRTYLENDSTWPKLSHWVVPPLIFFKGELARIFWHQNLAQNPNGEINTQRMWCFTPGIIKFPNPSRVKQCKSMVILGIFPALFGLVSSNGPCTFLGKTSKTKPLKKSPKGHKKEPDTPLENDHISPTRSQSLQMAL